MKKSAYYSLFALLIAAISIIVCSCEQATPSATLTPTQTEAGTVTPCENHVFTEWTVTKTATCAEDGEEAQTCTVCSYMQTKKVSKFTEHTYMNGGKCKYCEDKMDEGFQFDLNSDGKSYSVKYRGSAESVKVPSTFNELPVTAISPNGFWFKSEVKTVRLPATITEIGAGAFENCTNLKSINTPQNLTVIGKEAFRSCQNLVSFYIPKTVERIEEGTFDGCYSMSVNLHGSLKYIGKNAFNSCSAIKELIIPASVEEIGEGAFASCGNLTKIEIKEGTKLTRIGVKTFSTGENLRTVIIPEGILYIDAGAFSGHPHFDKVYLPSTLKSVGEKAFYLVGDTFNVYYNGTEQDFERVEFDEKWVDALTDVNIIYEK